MATSIKNGVYFIQNFGTGTVCELANGNSQNGTKIQGYKKRELDDSSVPAQLWVVAQVADDPVYSIQNANSRTYLTMPDSNPVNGTPLIGSEATGNPNFQRWAIYRNSKDTGYVIENKATGTSVDLRGGNPANGTPVQNWAGKGVQMTNKNQLWEFVSA